MKGIDRLGWWNGRAWSTNIWSVMRGRMKEAITRNFFGLLRSELPKNMRNDVYRFSVFGADVLYSTLLDYGRLRSATFYDFLFLWVTVLSYLIWCALPDGVTSQSLAHHTCVLTVKFYLFACFTTKNETWIGNPTNSRWHISCKRRQRVACSVCRFVADHSTSDISAESDQCLMLFDKYHHYFWRL